MTDEVPQGQRFSHLYLRPDQLAVDSPRLRTRLVLASREAVGGSAVTFGSYLERELGIRVLRRGTMTAYVPWDDLARWELKDVLDTITLVSRFLTPDAVNTAKVFAREVTRIFAEESANYRLDNKFGIHPAVDAAYQATFDASVRSLGSARFQAVREHLAKADDELLSTGNSREAIRSGFDAVENLFKQLFPRATNINRTTIQNDLRPLVDRLYSDPPEKRTALKIVESLVDWVDACHNYRHEPGHSEPTPPEWDLAVLVVSQSIAFSRWLAVLLKRSEERALPE